MFVACAHFYFSGVIKIVLQLKFEKYGGGGKGGKNQPYCCWFLPWVKHIVYGILATVWPAVYCPLCICIKVFSVIVLKGLVFTRAPVRSLAPASGPSLSLSL